MKKKTIIWVLSGMAALVLLVALNPILENNAFVSIQSGEINGMEFYINANNAKATGTMELRYRGLDFDVVDMQSGEATGAAEHIKSVIADWVVMDWNPMPGQEMRPGAIDYERDPEKFVFNYMVKSLTSGIKTSVTKE